MRRREASRKKSNSESKFVSVSGSELRTSENWIENSSAYPTMLLPLLYFCGGESDEKLAAYIVHLKRCTKKIRDHAQEGQDKSPQETWRMSDNVKVDRHLQALVIQSAKFSVICPVKVLKR